MTDLDLDAIVQLADDHGRQGTHWNGCYASHPRCALVRLVAEVRRLEDENAALHGEAARANRMAARLQRALVAARSGG
jgi:hypothetical protein